MGWTILPFWLYYYENVGRTRKQRILSSIWAVCQFLLMLMGISIVAGVLLVITGGIKITTYAQLYMDALDIVKTFSNSYGL
jgi:hypothetical protein